jgi:hypothetical protein
VCVCVCVCVCVSVVFSNTVTARISQHCHHSARPSSAMLKFFGISLTNEEKFIRAAQKNNVSELRRLIAADVDKDYAVDEDVMLHLLRSGIVLTGT